MSIRIELGQWNSVFAVPGAVTDKHLKLATEAQLKVLLYILRRAGEDIGYESIAEATGIDKDEIDNAVDFWCERGLLRKDDGVLSPEIGETAVKPQVSELVHSEKPAKHTAVSRAVRPDSAFVSKLLREDTALAGLLEEAQSVMNKPLSPGDTATLVMLYDTFGLPCEVIAMLLNYAAGSGRPNMRQIERLGIDWSDNGVFTVDDAEREIEREAASREAWGRAATIFGLKNSGKPSKAQLSTADRWLNQWGFNDEMIAEAYERCVNAKGEYNMSYINAILKRWYEKRIFSLDTLKADEAAKAKIKKGGSQKGSVFSSDGASFDISKYENQSIFDE